MHSAGFPIFKVLKAAYLGWLAIALVLASPTLCAQEVELRKATIGDVLRRDWAQIMQAQQETTRNKAEFNQQIAAARREFLESIKNPAKRAKAEAEFARLLYAKDVVYMSLYLSEGFSDSNVQKVRGLMLITGGELDNGIPAEGWNTFVDWVRGLRAYYGVTRDGQMLFLNPADAGSKDKLMAALRSNDSLYDRYKAIRDRQEIQIESERRKTEENIATAKAEDGGVRLHKQEAMPLAPWMLAEFPDGAFSKHLFQSSANVQVLQCTYGPSLTSRGEEGYSQYHFWHGQAPADIGALLQEDRQQTLRFLGAEGVARCPASSNQAIARVQKAMAEHPHRQSSQPAQRETQTVPATQTKTRTVEDPKATRDALRKVQRSADELRKQLRRR